MPVDAARGKVTVKCRRAGVICRLQGVWPFIGAEFDNVGAGLAGAGLAWDRVEDLVELIMPGSGTRALGHWGGVGG
eukprot:9270362-Pyramimonas_sp.AAC.1